MTLPVTEEPVNLNEDYFGQPMAEYAPNKLPPYYVMWKPHQSGFGQGGYKIYVSTEMQYAGLVARTVLPVLRQGRNSHKFIPTTQYVSEVYGGVYDDTSRGKFIVIYAGDHEVEVYRIIAKIDALLLPHGLPLAATLIPTDRHSVPPGPCRSMGKSRLIFISHVTNYRND
jgi:hypothetical protein